MHFGYILASVALFLVAVYYGVEARRARIALDRLGKLAAEYAAHAGDTDRATDPALLERLESCERRVATGLEDIQRVFRKTAQERRRIEKSAGIDEDGGDDLEDSADLREALRASLSPDRMGDTNGHGAARIRLRKR